MSVVGIKVLTFLEHLIKAVNIITMIIKISYSYKSLTEKLHVLFVRDVNGTIVQSS